MSDKGFIEPHASHLPRRKRERTKTAPVLISHQAQLQQHQLEQQQQLERLQIYQQDITLESASETQPNIHPSPTIHPNPPDPLPPAKPPQISTHPHRDNLPRRNRANTVPNNSNNTRARTIPPPIPISIVDSQSTIGADAHGQTADSINVAEEDMGTLSSLYPPPFKLNSKALSLISMAQNKAFKSHIVIENDSSEDDLDRRQLSSSVPTSPQLPHPAMGLTMGIMEAYATEEKDEVEVGNPRRAHAMVRHGLSYSPALGVKGTPPPPLPSSTFFPVHTTRFVPLPASVPIPASSSVPMIPKPSFTTPSPILPPVSAPLGQNLPRRHHRCRQKGPQMEAEVGGGGEKKGKEVLRLERVNMNVSGAKENRVEGNEEEDGLFSSLLDFGRAGSVGATSRTETSLHCVGFSSRGKWKQGRDESCIQVLGRSCVEVGYMLEAEGNGKEDYVLVEATGQDEGGEQRRLELCLHDDAAVCREGVPSLLPEQVRAGCEFMKEWIGCGEGTRRIRISVPRRRAPDAFGLAVCFLVWAEDQRGEKYVPLKVSDVASEPGSGEVYTPIHLLYMSLLDDGEGRGEEEREWDLRGKGKGVSGLGIEEEAEGGRSAHSDSTNGSSRPTLVRRGRGYHVREPALGRPSDTSSSSSSPSPSIPSGVWTGLRDEWRGVLSYEGLNTLAGVWP